MQDVIIHYVDIQAVLGVTFALLAPSLLIVGGKRYFRWRNKSLRLPFDLAMEAMGKEQYVGAIGFLEKSWRTPEVDAATVHLMLARCYRAIASLPKAREHYLAHIAAKPERFDARAEYLAMERDGGDFERYASGVLAAPEGGQAEELLLLHRANVHYRRGEHEQACRDLERLLGRNGLESEALMLLAQIYADMKEAELSIHFIDKAILNGIESAKEAKKRILQALG